jgi:plastocyanin
MSKLLLLALAGVTVAAVVAAPVLAGSVTVFQEDKKFSETDVTISAGQSVTFVNKDNVTHNVYSKTPGMGFDLRLQKPGGSSAVPFAQAGEADVMCAIHPQMKMKVIVVP